ncbi:hypothetical protein DCC39_06255 [Pueribacillus theae]|uniref:Uncharacterized protein n=1 Tax=Pueribacillus theae TaxID=2171751 RepID=A0A2U1K4E6_9BACI|nr:hypothetical protein [Pueribacillus theae]PWA12400.1 hypothetical protein DCC39_06255 [Pueribacillus theae]
MTLKKMKTKSLLCYSDLEYNRNLGLPIEVFCPLQKETVAFGRIEALSKNGVIVNQFIYPNHRFIFFGLTKQQMLYL